MQRRKLPVAGRHMLQENDMPGLLAAETHPLLLHQLKHVAVAHAGAQKLESLRLAVFM